MRDKRARSSPTLVDREAIRARADAATPGPWTAVRRNNDGRDQWSIAPTDDPYHEADREACAALGTCWIAHTPNGKGRRPPHPANAQFIAHARADIPALLAEVERLRVYEDDGALTRESLQETCAAMGRRQDELHRENERLRAELSRARRALGNRVLSDGDATDAVSTEAENERLRAENAELRRDGRCPAVGPKGQCDQPRGHRFEHRITMIDSDMSDYWP